MGKRSKSVSIVCTDCKTDFLLKINSIKQRVVCPKCKQSDSLSFGSSNVAGH